MLRCAGGKNLCRCMVSSWCLTLEFNALILKTALFARFERRFRAERKAGSEAFQSNVRKGLYLFKGGSLPWQERER